MDWCNIHIALLEKAKYVKISETFLGAADMFRSINRSLQS